MGDTWNRAEAVKKWFQFIYQTVAKREIPNIGKETVILVAKESHVGY